MSAGVTCPDPLGNPCGKCDYCKVNNSDNGCASDIEVKCPHCNKYTYVENTTPKKECVNDIINFEYKIRKLFFGFIEAIESFDESFCDCDNKTGSHSNNCMTMNLRKDIQRIEREYDEIYKEYKNTTPKNDYHNQDFDMLEGER